MRHPHDRVPREVEVDVAFALEGLPAVVGVYALTQLLSAELAAHPYSLPDDDPTDSRGARVRHENTNTTMLGLDTHDDLRLRLTRADPNDLLEPRLRRKRATEGLRLSEMAAATSNLLELFRGKCLAVTVVAASSVGRREQFLSIRHPLSACGNESHRASGPRVAERARRSSIRSSKDAGHVIHLLEQRGYCLWRAGEVERGTREFEVLLSRWERSPQCASLAWGWLLAEAARGSLHDVLFARVRAIYAREENAEDEMRSFGLSLSMLEPHPPHGV